MLTLLAGLALVLMGYRLFRAGFLKQAGDVEAGGHGVRVALKRAAPGTVFAVLGAAVMVAGIWKGLSQESEAPVAPPSVSPLLPQSFSPPSDSLRIILRRVANGDPIGGNERAMVANWLAQFPAQPSVVGTGGLVRTTRAAKAARKPKQ